MSKDEKSETLTGMCLYFMEQGMSGCWAFQDSKFMSPPKHGFPKEWSFEGLHYLQNGDHLTIFSPDNPKQIVWSGDVSIRQVRRNMKRDNIVGCIYYQKGVDRNLWAKWFVGEYPAELIPAK